MFAKFVQNSIICNSFYHCKTGTTAIRHTCKILSQLFTKSSPVNITILYFYYPFMSLLSPDNARLLVPQPRWSSIIQIVERTITFCLSKPHARLTDWQLQLQHSVSTVHIARSIFAVKKIKTTFRISEASATPKQLHSAAAICKIVSEKFCATRSVGELE